jgi:hypothetical protein
MRFKIHTLLARLALLPVVEACRPATASAPGAECLGELTVHDYSATSRRAYGVTFVKTRCRARASVSLVLVPLFCC